MLFSPFSLYTFWTVLRLQDCKPKSHVLNKHLPQQFSTKKGHSSPRERCATFSVYVKQGTSTSKGKPDPSHNIKGQRSQRSIIPDSMNLQTWQISPETVRKRSFIELSLSNSLLYLWHTEIKSFVYDKIFGLSSQWHYLSQTNRSFTENIFGLAFFKKLQ